VDHQTLIYLADKPIVIGWITRWLLLLQEFNFQVIYKPRKVQFVPDQLSCAKNGEPTIGVEDQVLDAIFFLIIVDKYAPIKEYFVKGYFEDNIPKEESKHLAIKSRPYTIYGLYKLGQDVIL
jgi:hypothetical protein